MRVKVDSNCIYGFWRMKDKYPEVDSTFYNKNIFQKIKEKLFPDSDCIIILDLFEHEDAIIAASLCEASIQRGD